MQRKTFLAGTAGAGAALALGTRTGAATLTTVRVGTVPVDAYAQPYFGDGAGIFRDVGIALEIVALANSGAIAAAVAGGSIDVGIGSPSQVAGAKEKGLPFTFFAPGGLYAADAPSSLLMVAKDSAIRTARDLAGKTIAVDNLTSFTQFGASRVAAEERRRSGHDQICRATVFVDGCRCIEAGRVDAAEISEPARSAARATRACLPIRTSPSVRAGFSAPGSRPRAGSPRTSRSRTSWPVPSSRRRPGPTHTGPNRAHFSRRSLKCRTTPSSRCPAAVSEPNSTLAHGPDHRYRSQERHDPSADRRPCDGLSRICRVNASCATPPAFRYESV